MIHNIVFDIGNVLIDFKPMAYLTSLFGEEKAKRVWQAVFGSGYWPELDLANLSEERILGLFYSAAPDMHDEIKEAFYRIGECVQKLDWVVPFIDSLKQKGYNVFFLSNMSEHVINSHPDAFAFTSHMDGGVWSCDVHTIKPGADIYKILLNKYSLTAEECLFIDDHPENIAACKKLGMKGIVFKSHDQLTADLDKALTKDAAHDKISVLCYGDSNTYAYDPRTWGRYPYEKRWTTLLGEMLGSRYEIIPEGLNGRTTAYDRPGAAWKNGISSFIACLGTHKPVDYIIIMLGTNDCNAGLDLSAEAIAGGMETLVRLVEEESPGLQGYVPEIIVAVPAAIRSDYENSPFAFELTPESVQKSHDIAPLYREIAERHGIRFADATTGIDVSQDCMHLSEEGHRQIAQLFHDVITNGLH